MKKSRFTEEQIAYALRQADSGTPVADVCRQLGVCEATFYVWKKKYGNLGVTELRQLRQLAGRKRPAEARGGRSDAGSPHPAGGARKKDLKPARRRELAHWIHERFQVSKQRRAGWRCCSRSTWYYRSQGEGSVGAAHAHPGTRAEPTAIRLPAHPRPAAA